MHKHHRIITLAVPLLLLSACGSQTAEPAAETASATPTMAATETTPAASGASDGAGAASAPAEEEVDEVGDTFQGETLKPGVYTGTTETGGSIMATFPVDAPEDVAGFMADVKAPEQGYIGIDYGGDSERMGIIEMTLVDAEGNELEYQTISDAADELRPTMRDDGPADKNDGYWYSLPDGTEVTEDEYNRLNEISMNFEESWPSQIAPMAQGSVLMVGPPVPDELLYVEVTVSGMESVPLDYVKEA